ncbi:hypothetical protein GGS21DRAFT_509148 [Xylaria nigripes]|nr:hypothetical protein GGS21DRAFT_509148 [Xylaria nigripes]
MWYLDFEELLCPYLLVLYVRSLFAGSCGHEARESGIVIIADVAHTWLVTLRHPRCDLAVPRASLPKRSDQGRD